MRGAGAECQHLNTISYTTTPPPLPGMQTRPVNGLLCTDCKLWRPIKKES